MHGYEIEYIFGQPFRKPKIYARGQLELEQNISRKIMKYWKQFSFTGKPVETWPKYNRISQQTFILDEKIADNDDGDVQSSEKSQGRFCVLLKEASDYRISSKFVEKTLTIQLFT